MNSRIGNDEHRPSASVRTRALAGAAAMTVLLAGCASTASGSSSESGFTKVSRPPAAYSVPAGWEEKPQDNVTHIIGGESPEQYVVHHFGHEALVQSSVMSPPQSEPTQDRVREAIDAGLDGMKSMTPQEIGYLREAVGLGCLGDATVVDPPRTEEVGEGYALRYGYTCLSAYGPARSIAITAYGWDGRKHSWTVSTTQDYWEEHALELEVSAASFRITD